jgi:hypothetical protein
MWETITRNRSFGMKKKAGTKNKMAGNSSDNKQRPGNQWQIIGIVGQLHCINNVNKIYVKI